VNAIYASLDKLDSPNFFLWIVVVREGGSPLRTRGLRSRLEKWLAGLDPDEHALPGRRRRDLPGLIHEDAGWKIDFRAIPKSLGTRGRMGARPLGVFGGGDAHWARDEEAIRAALADKGSAYGSLGAPLVVAVASSSPTLDDEDVCNALYGTEAIQVRLDDQGADPIVGARRPNGYWYQGDRWGHRGVAAVLVVRNLYPAFIGWQRHTIWEHPNPHVTVDSQFPIWRRSVIEGDRVVFIEPERSQAAWFGLSDPWPLGERFPRG
jgi:hypothetical protein